MDSAETPRAARPVRTATVVAWIVLAPWIVFLVIRLFGVDFDQLLIAVIGLTPYIAAASFFPLLLALVLRVWPAAVTAALVTVVFAVLVLPRAFGGPTEATPPGPPLRVLASNTMLGGASPEELTALVADLRPDVVSLEELTPVFAHQLDELGFEDEFPHRIVNPEAGSSGSGLYSRYPLTDQHLVSRYPYEPFVTATIQPAGAQPVQVTSVHTAPPTAKGWATDLGKVAPAPADGRAILLGDFNSTLDHAPFRDVLGRGWTDAAEAVGSGLDPTWPSDRNRLPPLYAIDHVLVGDALGVRSFSTHFVASTDHEAVYAELQLPGD